MSGGDWQLSCTEMKQRGAHLLESGQWSDCAFLVGTAPHQVLVRGHKLILAMASPVFEAMFYGGMPEGDNPIPILDVQPEAFKALLEYIYTDNIDISSFDKACELCYGAKKYMLPQLVKECTKYLWRDLHPKNACRAYEFAKLFEESVLMDKCIQIICTHTKEVLTDSSFDEVELNTLITVFSLDYLTIDSELDLFEAAERYSIARGLGKGKGEVTATGDKNEPSTSETSKNAEEKQCEVVNAESGEVCIAPVCASDNSSCPQSQPVPSSVAASSKDKEVKEQEKLSIRRAVEQIRFLTLTPQQYAQGPALSSLLTESESFAILMNILSSNAEIALPAGFSTCRVPRKPLIGINSGNNNIATFTVDTPSPVMVDHVCNKPAIAARPQPGQPAYAAASSFLNQSAVMPTPAHPAMAAHMIPEQVDRHAMDFSKIYCQRAIIQHTDCLNTSALDCSVTFMVDKNICVLGVQVPTQVLSEESAAAGVVGGCSGSTYSELLYAHLLDADGARLTYTHYTSRVPYTCLLDIMFNRPVYIQRNKVYKVGIVFNKVGWYPMGTCAQQVAAESVYFNFGIGQSSDSVRDGLIRTIIFTY